MSRGRKPATGRFESRAELCAWVWRQHLRTPANISDIARQCRVSAGVVSKILDGGEGRPLSQQQLEACATDVAALFRGYTASGWAIDRMFGLEFISDQQGDEMHEAFARSCDRDLLRYGYHPLF